MKKNILIVSITCMLGFSTIALAGPRERGQNRPDANETVVELIADYDTSGDNALDATELAAGLNGLHEKRVAQMEARREKMAQKDGEGRQRGPRENSDPSEMATRALDKFDADEDASLNSEELLQFLESMEKRGSRGNKGKRGPKAE